MSHELVPPHDLVAESALVGACLVVPDKVLPEIGWFASDDCYDVRNRLLMRTVRELEAAGAAIDLVTVQAALQNAGTLEHAGGTRYLVALADASPGIRHVAEHARIVARHARLRRLQATCREIVAEAYAPDDADSFMATVEQRVADACAVTGAKETLVTLRECIEVERSAAREVTDEELAEAPPVGIRTGMPTLDRTIGGLRRGVKTTVAARPGMGKTAFALSVALNVASAGHGVAFVSIEMTREQLAARAVSIDSGIPTQVVEGRRFARNQWPGLAQAWRDLSLLPFVIDDAEEQTPTSIRASVRRAARRLQSEYKKSLDLVIVDHVHIVTSTLSERATDEARITQISTAHRIMAKQLGCAVLELCQLNRDVEKRADRRPVMADLRGSGSLEQDAFAILMLYREDQYRDDPSEHDGRAEVLVRKVRQGGQCRAVDVHFLAECTRFYEKADGYDDLDHRASLRATSDDYGFDDRYDGSESA